MTEKKLTRSSTNKMVGGVAGGMATYFNMDANLMRVLWVLAGIFLFPLGPIAYIALMFILPEE